MSVSELYKQLIRRHETTKPGERQPDLQLGNGTEQTFTPKKKKKVINNRNRKSSTSLIIYKLNLH